MLENGPMNTGFWEIKERNHAAEAELKKMILWAGGSLIRRYKRHFPRE